MLSAGIVVIREGLKRRQPDSPPIVSARSVQTPPAGSPPSVDGGRTSGLSRAPGIGHGPAAVVVRASAPSPFESLGQSGSPAPRRARPDRAPATPGQPTEFGGLQLASRRRSSGIGAPVSDDAGRIRGSRPRQTTDSASPDPEAQRRALATVRTALDDRGVFNWVTLDEARTAVDAIAQLSPADAAAVIQTMEQEGLLTTLGQKLEGHGDDGAALASRFGSAMGRKLDGAGLATLAQAMRGAGESTRAAFVDGFSRTATTETKLGFVRAAARLTTDGTSSPSDLDTNFGSVSHTRFEADGDAASVATVIGTLRGQDAARALESLSAPQRAAVFDGAINARDVSITTTGGMGMSSTSNWTSADASSFRALADAVGSIPNQDQRVRYMNEALAAVGRADDVSTRDRAAMAQGVLANLDSATLARLRPDALAIVGDGLARGPDGPRAALRTINALEASPNRDALVRTMFLKTPERAFRSDSALAGEYARGLAAAQGEGANAGALQRALSTANGRAMLADANIPGSARLWAARELMRGNRAVQGALSSSSPWENHGLLESHARARVEQFAARGDQAVAASGRNIENLIGAGLGVPVRGDLPTDEAGIARVQAEALNGRYNYYQGNRTVDQVAAGVREARRQMGGGDVRIATLPIQFSSQDTGPIDLQLYRVEGENGQSRFVDNIGRVYGSFEQWRTDNQLPPGKMTYPAGGHLGDAGQTRLVTENTPDTSDTFWEHAGDVADVAALAGGVVASGVIIAGSGGTATPLVAGAWAVALGSAGYMGVRAGMDLYDRSAHGQTLSLSDPDARAAWLSLAGSGLTIAGAGFMSGATSLASSGSRLAPTVARAAGILNASANFADAASTVDQANTLVTNWDQLSPGQRAQMGLSIAFWGGMTGVSARAGGGRISDAFSFRAQMNSALIESGAAVRANPAMAPGHARVNTGYGDGGRLNLSVEYGPGTSATSIDIHRQVARQLIDNSGAQGLVRRALGDGTQFRPGTRGEEVALEVVKHRALVDAYDAQIGRAPPAERPGLIAERNAYASRLAEYEGELGRLRADPSAANGPPRGHVDADSSIPIHTGRDGAQRLRRHQAERELAQLPRHPSPRDVELAGEIYNGPAQRYEVPGGGAVIKEGGLAHADEALMAIEIARRTGAEVRLRGEAAEGADLIVEGYPGGIELKRLNSNRGRTMAAELAGEQGATFVFDGRQVDLARGTAAEQMRYLVQNGQIPDSVNQIVVLTRGGWLTWVRGVGIVGE